MKIVLTTNEIKAWSRLLTRVGVSFKELESVLTNMKEDETLTHAEIVDMFRNRFDDETIAKLNKNRKVMSITRNPIGTTGVCTYTFLVSEEFVCDANELYGDLIVETVDKFKSMVKALRVFFNDKAEKFLDKWKIK